MERIHNSLAITRRALFRKPGDCPPPALAEISKGTSQAEQHLLHRNHLRCCPMLEDKQPIWDFLLRGREMSEDSGPRTSTASKEKVEDWDKLGGIHEAAVILEAPSRLIVPGVAAEPQRKELQAQLLHQPAHPGERSQRGKDRNA